MSAYWNEMRKFQQAVENLIQSTELLADIHSRGKVYGKLIPSCSAHSGEMVRQDMKPNLPIPEEFSNEWRPAEEKDSEPSQAGDIFSAGCCFYSVFTGGQHPFGKSGHRTRFIANNLYDLTECQDGHLRKLIARMICHDSAKRPTSSDLLNHPYLWKEERMESYLMTLAANFDENSDNYQIWKGMVLFSSDRQSDDFDTVQETSIVKSVTEILMEIKEKKETVLNACHVFPDLLSSIYFTENPNVTLDEIDNSRPEIFGNVLIANRCFGEVKPLIGIKRRHGRFGLQPVHVIQFPCFTVDSLSLMKRLSVMHHQNLLRFFYLAENSVKNLVLACEPFDETLDTWMAKNDQLINFETAKDILTQITTGLVYYHSKNVVHGNLTSNQIAITTNGIVTAKISKFLIDEKESTEIHSPKVQNDVRKLGTIISDLLAQVLDVPPSSDHLVRSMQDMRDKRVPPSEAVLYHPFFWSSEEIADFLLVAGDFYAENQTIDRNSQLDIGTSSAPERQHLKTNRSAIEYFSSCVSPESAPEELELLAIEFINDYPTLVIQTWLRLQKLKSDDDNLQTFYHPIYDFPTYEKLLDATEGNINTQIALSGKRDDEDFFIEPFEKSNEPECQGPQHVTQSYLDNYLQKWTLATKDHGTTSTVMKHPTIDPLGRTAMHLACHSDVFYESAITLLNFGFNPNIADKNGFVPLHVAALNNSFKIAQLLIENKAVIDLCNNKELRTPLFLAALSNSIFIIELLINMSADANKVDASGQSPLHIAADLNSTIVAELLLKSGANVNAVDVWGRSPLHIAVVRNSIPMARLLIANKAKANVNQPGKTVPDTPLLHIAVSNKSLQMVNLLLAVGTGDPNLATVQGISPLHIAASLKPPCPIRLQMVDLLINRGAKVDAADNVGRTPLHVATFNVAEEVVKRLLECPLIEINPRDTDRGITPLHLAAWYGLDNIAKVLIEHKAKVDAEDKFRQTPLEYAASSNAVNVAKQLLEAGSMAKSRNNKRSLRSPLHITAAHGAREVAELLIDKGADVNATDDFDLTPLHYAECRNQKNFVQFLQRATTTMCYSAISPLSKQLTPADMAVIQELTNSFEQKSMYLPGVEISLSNSENQVTNITVAHQKVLMY